jgi:outer membrane lipoprotein-sorting protein
VKQHVHLKFAICSLLVLIAAPGFAVQAPQPRPFSADMAVTGAKNGENVTGKVYFSLPRTRMDMAAQGKNISMISNGSTQTSYMIMHDQRMYIEVHGNQPNPMTRKIPSLDSSFDAQNPCGKQRDVTCKKEGTESVNGRMCDKWVSTDWNRRTSTTWVDQKLYVPIRVISFEGTTMNLTNIKEGAPAASTFEVPAGYTKMNLDGRMGGGRPPR